MGSQKSDNNFSTNLQMYCEIPTQQIFIEEFQQLAIERVKFFRILETVSARNIKDKSYKDQVAEEMAKQNCKTFLSLVKGYADRETRRKDYLSHFILRLAYCRSEEYRRWFLARELDFFRLKFMNIDKKEDVMIFMKNNNLKYTPIEDNEKINLSSELLNSTGRNLTVDTTDFYKVPFTKVVDLIRNRKVFLKAGYAYVPYHDLLSVLSGTFRTQLSYWLSICAANLPTLESDERLTRILKGLHTSYTGNDYGVKVSKNCVPLSALDSLSRKSFPLCMRMMYDTFQKAHHLKYGARQQLGLFLKGIGVSMEDSLRFWKEGFTSKGSIDSDKFDKQYAYNIRHNYGQEGKRANYTPHSCAKIIGANVGPGDNHGCPFRHYDVSSLRSRITDVGHREASDIIELASRGHCQLACTKYFEITHNVQNVAGINHPNQYFEQSQQFLGPHNSQEAEKKTSNNLSDKISQDDWDCDDSQINFDLTRIENEANMMVDN